jgi:hypothetical protein
MLFGETVLKLSFIFNWELHNFCVSLHYLLDIIHLKKNHSVCLENAVIQTNIKKSFSNFSFSKFHYEGDIPAKKNVALKKKPIIINFWIVMLNKIKKHFGVQTLCIDVKTLNYFDNPSWPANLIEDFLRNLKTWHFDYIFLDECFGCE